MQLVNIFDFHEISGTEQTLANCSHYGWENHRCYHGKDVGVKCTNDTTLNHTKGSLGIVLKYLNHGQSWGNLRVGA